jgi:hypothetical protein
MFRSVLCAGILIAAALAFLPEGAEGQPKNPKAKVEKATVLDYHYMGQMKSISGKLVSIDNKSITVRITFPEYQPNPNYKPGNGQAGNLNRHFNELQVENQRLAASKSPNQAAGHMRQIAHLQNLIGIEMAKANSFNPNNPPFKTINHEKDFDIALQENAVFRKMILPSEYDDTGNLKTYTKEKLAELRGKDPNPKGSYSATAGEFHPGQIVGVYLSPPGKGKTTAPTTKSSSSDDGKGTKKEMDDEVDASKATVRMLVLMQDGTMPATTTDKKGPPKK